MTRSDLYFAALVLVGQLLSLGQVGAEPLQAGDQASEAMSYCVSVPKTDRLNLVSSLPVIVGGVILAG